MEVIIFKTKQYGKKQTLVIVFMLITMNVVGQDQILFFESAGVNANVSPWLRANYTYISPELSYRFQRSEILLGFEYWNYRNRERNPIGLCAGYRHYVTGKESGFKIHLQGYLTIGAYDIDNKSLQIYSPIGPGVSYWITENLHLTSTLLIGPGLKKKDINSKYEIGSFRNMPRFLTISWEFNNTP